MADQSHIIGRQILDTSFSSREEAMRMQNEISGIYHQDLLPLINKIFDGVLNEDENLRIDRLEIDLGPVSIRNIREDLKAKLQKKLEDELSKVVDRARRIPALHQHVDHLEPDVSVRSTIQSDLELFVSFIATGRLPWWAQKSKFISLQHHALKLIGDQPEALAITVRQLIRDNDYAARIIHQFPDAILEQFIQLLRPEMMHPARSLHHDLYAIHQHRQLLPLSRSGFRLALWQSAFTYSVSASTSFDIVKVSRDSEKRVPVRKGTRFVPSAVHDYATFLIDELSRNSHQAAASKHDTLAHDIVHNVNGLRRKGHSFKTRSLNEILGVLLDRRSKARVKNNGSQSRIKGDKLSKKNKVAPRKPDAGEGIAIQNAGLVLLWPFLPAFFEGIGLTARKSFITADAARRGALLLQYLATKETEIPEYDLVLNKLLCGIDLDEPLPSSLDITAVEQEEAEHLLNVVAERWEALKGTSGEGLRRTFLLKEGVLHKHMNGWKLIVERTAIDTLLDKLPWSISLIKLPWCEQILYVEW